MFTELSAARNYRYDMFIELCAARNYRYDMIMINMITDIYFQ